MKPRRYKGKWYRALGPTEIIHKGDYVVVQKKKYKYAWWQAQKSIGIMAKDYQTVFSTGDKRTWVTEVDPLIAAMMEVRRMEKVRDRHL